MTNTPEIIAKATKKAMDNGWKPPKIVEGSFLFDGIMRDENVGLNIKDLIYDHDFAKALWGDDGYTLEGLHCYAAEGIIRYWQYHLRCMVIAEDPIKYLTDNI